MKLKCFCFCLLFVFVSCSHLPEDPHVNPAEYGNYRMEFDIQDNTSLKKEIGVGNISLQEGQSLDGISFKIYAVGKGTMYLKSNACGINISKSFTLETVFYLKDLIDVPTKCAIEIVAESDKFDNKEHRIVESGVVKLNLLPKNVSTLSMAYNRANDFGTRKDYSYIAQGSMQRQEGDLTRKEGITVASEIEGGGQYRVSGCGLDFSGVYNNNYFDIKFFDIYKKNYLKREDSCDFEIIALPNNSMYSAMARFSLIIYSKEVVKLEPLNFSIKGSTLTATGAKYIIGCAINNGFKNSNLCVSTYSKDNVYWIRSITVNARKNVYAIKNGSVFWSE